MWHDYVYYLKIDGDILEGVVFESEQAAKEFAELAEYENYEIVEWDVA